MKIKKNDCAARDEEARIRELHAKERAEEIRQLEARAQAEEKASATQFANLQGKFAAVRDGLRKKRIDGLQQPPARGFGSPSPTKEGNPAAIATAELQYLRENLALSPSSAIATKLDLATEHKIHMEKVTKEVLEKRLILGHAPNHPLVTFCSGACDSMLCLKCVS